MLLGAKVREMWSQEEQEEKGPPRVAKPVRQVWGKRHFGVRVRGFIILKTKSGVGVPV